MTTHTKVGRAVARGNKVKLALALVFALTGTLAQAQERYRFRNPDSERRYYEARREAQRYDTERRYYEAYAGELERRDRFFAPIRRGADRAFNYGTRALPRYGGAARQLYNRGMRYYRGE